MDKLTPHHFASAVSKVRKLSMFGPVESDQEKFKELFKMIEEKKVLLRWCIFRCVITTFLPTSSQIYSEQLSTGWRMFI